MHDEARYVRDGRCAHRRGAGAIDRDLASLEVVASHRDELGPQAYVDVLSASRPSNSMHIS
jgi:hypothetical protein